MDHKSVRMEQSGWDRDDSIDFYTAHRNRPEDLYPSERYFLPETVRRVDTCLDVGCAAGGFSQILRALNSGIRYFGVDVSKYMVTRAKRIYPGIPFVLTDGVRLPFGDAAFDLVHSSGILHLNSAYRDIVSACYAATDRYLIVDFRISPTGVAESGTFEIRFEEDRPPSGVLPYLILELKGLLHFLQRLKPRPNVIRARGYLHPPSPAAVVSHKEVVMAAFLIEKPVSGVTPTRMEIDLPCQ